MKKLSILILLLGGMGMLSESVFADTSPLLNNVSYQVTEQQWVKASKATAVISINATVSDQNIASLRQSILKNLQQIAQGDWHITQFNRNKTSSGLESIQAQAQIRLPANQFDQINSRVKKVSRAGQTYTVADLNFNPSPEDIASTQFALRNKIYKDIQTELSSLNKEFPKSHYFVHQIHFQSGGISPRAMVLAKTATPSVSQQVTLTAQVTLSSTVDDVTKGRES